MTRAARPPHGPPTRRLPILAQREATQRHLFDAAGQAFERAKCRNRHLRSGEAWRILEIEGVRIPRQEELSGEPGLAALARPAQQSDGSIAVMKIEHAMFYFRGDIL
jgi:hypothetical protein